MSEILFPPPHDGRTVPVTRLRNRDAGTGGPGALFRAAEVLPPVSAASRALVWRRISETLRRRKEDGIWVVLLHPRIWRPAVAVGIVFLSGGVVGAALLHRLAPIDAPPEPVLEPGITADANPARKQARRRTIPAATVPAAPPVPAAATVSIPTVVSPPTVSLPAAAATGNAMATPESAGAPRRWSQSISCAAAKAARTDAIAAGNPNPAATGAGAVTAPGEHVQLGEAMRLLYQEKNAMRALAALDKYAKEGSGALAPEAAATRVDALVVLGRRAEALRVLERISPADLPRGRDRLVLRGELRAAAGRWRDARGDFDIVLGGNLLDRAFERALYGRALCLGKLGDHEAARAALDRYLALFPSGQFAQLATRPPTLSRQQ